MVVDINTIYENILVIREIDVTVTYEEIYYFDCYGKFGFTSMLLYNTKDKTEGEKLISTLGYLINLKMHRS